jgi:transaldolase
MTNPLRELEQLGQSVWYDGLRRAQISSGELARMIVEDGLKGLTTNPAIYEKAIVSTRDYDAELATLFPRADLDAKAIYEQLAIHDLQAAADLLRPVYQASEGRDGFVSLEVSPAVAHDADATLFEARRLWREVGRQNLMIKVPGTPEALPVIRQLLADGVNVNVTLLFARSAWARVAEVHVAALEERLARGLPVTGVASVASFFVSRIDTAADDLLEKIAARADSGALRQRAEALRGQVAIANAKLAYRDWQALVATDRWRRLAMAGAQPQRLLWASTSSKNPRYRDVVYVESLIGPETVDTVPPATFDAFREHGRVEATLERDVPGAQRTLDELAGLGISIDEITDRLLVEGVRLFAEPFAKLLANIEGRRPAERALQA